ncbi:ABC transporter ATP-binding protein [Rhizobium sp. TRM96647]|uniref:ABC transporter ATP-binding protein n=1 Tax=unclassified Rhizobium TaxID=2613769 RepID=UPI0021E85EAD|nr:MULTISPECIES: ABC transporter ATP-binding protein [unclassified Rhizobium]MCV3739540.1 ABC transporter ATP-binding protein [Rhizobium sp. TRM96647]MCV3761226.1 ABC transporter ATP-binding protein [Rhizobium sp. TRM96650]
MIGQSLSLRGIRKAYDTTYAVHETDLEIGAGEFVSIVGPSGSGKTTLLTMIAGFERPTTGSIVVGNADITRLAPNRRDIGMVFQRYALFPHMTVRKNLEFPLRMRKRHCSGDLGRRVDSMLDMVQLGPFAHRYPHQLSGGQQQRVAVGRALVFNPPVLLMDEPLGALDKKLRETMQLEIKRLQQQLGATIVYVTHDQEEALTLSDRVAVMHKGRLEQIGRPLELYTEPQSAFVADFVGTVNFIPGVIVGSDCGTATIRIATGAIIETVRNGKQPLPVGARASIAIRPEHIRICPPGSETSGLPGTLENLVFSGASRTAHVSLTGMEGQTLRMQVPNEFASLPEPGGRLAIDLPSDKMKLFHADDGRRL